MEEKKKVVLGQFFTRDKVWLQPQVIDFIRSTHTSVAYDPFAGEGHLLDASIEQLEYKSVIGLDIDSSLKWKINDSLESIPHIDDAIIITNPPYLSNYSAARKKVNEGVEKYFSKSEYDDVYMIALDKMLESQPFIVAIIPETFINSSYKQKNRLSMITVLEQNPFEDTDTPVLVACFDNRKKDLDEVKVYRDNEYINTLGNIERMRLIPDKKTPLVFNDINGWLGVRCVDTTNPNDMIRFDFKEKIDYDWDGGIKVSSRLLTLIDIDVPVDKRDIFITECNDILFGVRSKSADLILSPFKGNMKNGRRRRRLDFLTCRSIMEKAYKKTVLCEGDRHYEQCRLF